jgi:hypothetical protein
MVKQALKIEERTKNALGLLSQKPLQRRKLT